MPVSYWAFQGATTSSVLAAQRGSGFAQEFFSFRVIRLGRMVGRSIAVFIDNGWVSAVLQQHLDDLDLALTRCKHQCGPTFNLTDVVGVRTVIEEKLGRGREWS